MGERKRTKALTGTLYITLKQARELEHIPIITSGWGRSSSKQVTETIVSIKVEGNQIARSHPSRTDRWNEEFDIPVDKANEVEIVVYDKQGANAHPAPIGVLWIRINDVVEALRRQRIVNEAGQGQWVTAGAMPGDTSPTSAYPGSMGGGSDGPLDFRQSADLPNPQRMAGSGNEGIEAWFSVEPVGGILLRLNFGAFLRHSPC